MNQLWGQGVPCLPMHDAVILPYDAAARAVGALQAAFGAVAGVAPRVTVKGSVAAY